MAGSRAVDDVVDLVLHQHVTFFFFSLSRKQTNVVESGFE